MDLLSRRASMFGGKKEYIIFADPEVERLCIANWSSDSIGVTMADAAAVTSLGTVFKGNTDIVYFDELQYFVNATTWPTSGSGGNARGVFSGCTNLVSVTLRPGQTIIPIASFWGCTSLESVNTSTNLTTINDYAFYNCSSLTTIDLSELTTVKQYSFSGASLSGKTLHLPNLTSIGSFAFTNTSIVAITSLGSITSIPDGNQNQSTGVFSGCSSLTSVVLPSTLTTVGSFAFYNCAITSINFPSSITKMNRNAFANLKVTGNLTITQSITLNSAVFLNHKYTKITFDNNVAGISGSLNGWLSTLYGSNLQELDFSANQTSKIDSYPVKAPSGYAGCPLNTIIIRATTPPTITQYTFNGMSSLAHIYVPASAVATYQAAQYWSAKASIISAIPT